MKNKKNLLSYILNASLLIIVITLSLRLVHILFNYLEGIIVTEGFKPYNEINEATDRMPLDKKIVELKTKNEKDEQLIDEVAKEIQRVMETRQSDKDKNNLTHDNSKKLEKLEKLKIVNNKFVDLDPLELKGEKSAVPLTVENYQFKTVYQKLDEVNIPSKTKSVKEICGMTGNNKDKIDGCIACKVNHRESEFKVNENDSGTNIMNICQYKNGHKSLYKNNEDIWTREECVAKCSTVPDYI